MVKKKVFDTVQFNEHRNVQEDSELFQKVCRKGAKYGLVGQNVKTSDRRFQNMNSVVYIKIASSIVFAFFRRFLGIKDSKKFLEKFKEMYGPLGGNE